MLTARDTTHDKVTDLCAGADDYLVKPFKLEELSARIRALQRCSREIRPQVLQHGALQLDPASQVVTCDKEVIALTPKGYLLLEYFMRHPNQVLSRVALLNKLWEFDQESGKGTIKTHLTNCYLAAVQQRPH